MLNKCPGFSFLPLFVCLRFVYCLFSFCLLFVFILFPFSYLFVYILFTFCLLFVYCLFTVCFSATGDEYLNLQGIDSGQLWYNEIALASMTTILMFLAYVALRVIKKEK